MKKYFALLLAILILGTVALPAVSAAEPADNQEPSDVENIKVVPYNGAVKVSWNEAADDTAVDGYQVHYGTKPVTGEGQSYEKVEDVGNVEEAMIDGLTNDTEYYFSVIAYDAAGNESVNWGNPVNAAATPKASLNGAEDKTAPTVAKAEAMNKEQVKVEFSEEVVLPTEDPQDAFGIENDDNFEPLVVTGAEMDEEDETNKTVILTTAAQTKDVSYTLTVGIDIKDKAGNPIISGTSDTAAFTGSDTEKPAEDAAPAEGLKIEKVDVVDNTHITVTFDRTVVLSIDPSKDFTIKGKDAESKKLEILGVELGKNAEGVEDASAIITTSPQEAITYVVAASNKLKDEDGNAADPTKATGDFRGVAPAAEEPPADIVPPADVAKFLAETMIEAEKYVVKLTWERVREANADSVKQTVYMSEDGTEYAKKADLDAEATEYEVKNLEAGDYWFKLTQTDAAGNESEGKIMKVMLSETGPEMAGLLLLSIGFGRLFKKKQ